MTFPPAVPGMSSPPSWVGPWMTRQRWYANKGTLPALEEIGNWSLESTEPGVRIVTHLLLDHTIGKPALYQVPFTYRERPLADDSALVAESEGEHVYDAPHDSAYTAALLEFISTESEARGDRAWARGRHSGAAAASRLVSHVLRGEQSNTSIIYEAPGSGEPIICKLFRTLHDGDNPDVELQTALAAAGSDAVPRSLGHVVADWRDTGEPSGRAHGHLVFAQEFLTGSQDAWRVAVDAAADGIDFTDEARALGIATAGVHATLATTLPTSEASQVDIDAVIDHMHGRLAAAITEVPALDRFAPAIRDVFGLASLVDWPAQQRIHGDLHLGQVLSAPGRGWVLVDFEGEPLRPMRERSRLDSPLRDVAGMLRSFDYVAGSLAVAPSASGSAAALDEWAAAARAAYADGYSEASGCDLRANRALLDAFELDKALYEIVYEARNRPTWLPIPVAAIERLSSRVARA